MTAWGVTTARLKPATLAARVAEILESGSGNKMLFFAHHHCMLDAMTNALRAARAFRTCASTARPPASSAPLPCVASRRRPSYAWRFCPSRRAARITLTAASDVVFGELHWVPAAMLQAEDRAHRIGQKNPVNVRYLCAAGTLDDIVWPAVSRKLERLGVALDGAAAGLGAERVDGAEPERTEPDAGVLKALMSYYACNPANAFMAAGQKRAPAGVVAAAADAADAGAPPGGVHARDIRAFFRGERDATRRVRRIPKSLALSLAG